MAIGGSVLLILAGLIVASGLGHRNVGLAMAGFGLVALCLAIILRYRPVWLRERRRQTYARLRAARLRSIGVWTAPVVSGPVRVGPLRNPRRRRRGAPAQPAPQIIAPVPEQPLSNLAQVESLVDHSRRPGQHGKLPPSPRGKLRYP